MSYFLELLINGAFTGLMYSMVALGIVLIYKSSGVLNFAQGALVMMGGYTVYILPTFLIKGAVAAIAVLGLRDGKPYWVSVLMMALAELAMVAGVKARRNVIEIGHRRNVYP